MIASPALIVNSEVTSSSVTVEILFSIDPSNSSSAQATLEAISSALSTRLSA